MAIEWPPVLDAARTIVEGYDTPVTLRQLFYRLVARQLIPNTQNAYKRLSELTAAARRDGEFPDLTDRTREIHEYQSFTGPADALSYLSQIYRRDRTEGQEYSLYLAVEKAGIVNQFDAWFGQPFGIPILALGGYASQSYVDEIARHVEAAGRPAVLLIGGDHDPSGWDIPRDFVARTACWKEVQRVVLDPDQVAEYDLPVAFGKESDSRKTGFTERFGELVQVELDALPVEVLRELFTEALNEYWDASAYQAALDLESGDVDVLNEFIEGADGS